MHVVAEESCLGRENDLCTGLSGRGAGINTSIKSSYFSYIQTSKECNQNLHIFIDSLSLIVKSCYVSGSV